MNNVDFKLPAKMESLLRALSEYYQRKGQDVYQTLVVNSTYSVDTGVDYDGWDGGIYGHEVNFNTPSAIYFDVFDELDVCQTDLRDNLNRLNPVEQEWVCRVKVQLANEPTQTDWRAQSGALIDPAMAPSEKASIPVNGIWKSGHFRLFLSHRANVKGEVHALKEALEPYGVSCFVAHDDIQPTREWQQEIERALFSMDALSALLTADFATSEWTDQEVGIALGREVPVLAVRVARDPYGFIGKYQGMKGLLSDPGNVARGIYDLLWEYPALHISLANSLVAKLSASTSYAEAKLIAPLLSNISAATPKLVAQLKQARQNPQVADAWGVPELIENTINRLAPR